MSRFLSRFGAVGTALSALLACAGIGGSSTFASARADVAAQDAAALDMLLAAAGRAPDDLAVLSAEDWGRTADAAIVLAATRVTHLRLRDAGLASMAPLAALDALREVDLSGNRIAVIEGVGPSLEVLTLRGNTLVGLHGLDACTALRWLYVDDNRILSLMGLAALPALQDFSLNGNQLTTLDGLAGRASLTGLYVERNHLTSLDGVRDLPALGTLAAGNNAITRTDGLANVPKLQNLSLAGNPVEATTAAQAPATANPTDSLVPALPAGGGTLSKSRSGVQTRGSGGFSEQGTITRLSGVAFLELNSRSSGGSAARDVVLDLTTGAEPVRVYSAGVDGGFRARLVPAGQTARLEGRLVQGGGMRAYGVWLEVVGGGAASGIRYHGRSPGK